MTKKVRYSQRELISKRVKEINFSQKMADAAFILKRISENKNLTDSQKKIIELVKNIE